MMSEVIVRLDVEGVHCWPDCNLEEVSYLKHEHRHIFKIEVRAPVSHDEREIEFIELKHQVLEYLNAAFFDEDKYLCNFKSLSCESIAKLILQQFKNLIECSVFEDGENGARVFR